MPIQGTPLGTTSTFQIIPIPSGKTVPLQSGPTVSVDDPNVTLTQPDANGDFTASVAASDTGAQYNLTISGVNGAGTPISNSFPIPILPAPAVQQTGFDLNQIS